jgi:hypothetical protein
MRKYKIFKTDLGYWIYKKREKDWFISMRFLDWKDKWTLNKDCARTFYHREDAVSALVLIKTKDGKETD